VSPYTRVPVTGFGTPSRGRTGVPPPHMAPDTKAGYQCAAHRPARCEASWARRRRHRPHLRASCRTFTAGAMADPRTEDARGQKRGFVAAPQAPTFFLIRPASPRPGLRPPRAGAWMKAGSSHPTGPRSPDGPGHPHHERCPGTGSAPLSAQPAGESRGRGGVALTPAAAPPANAAGCSRPARNPAAHRRSSRRRPSCRNGRGRKG